jgi:hypothetical protein
MRYIGDIHGRLDSYRRIIKEVPESIQVGDFGMGFKPNTATYVDRYLETFKGNHRFIRGNHDNLSVCKESKYWIPDGRIENDTMFIGGANSIDKQYRVEHIDWWRDEELSSKELYELLDSYILNKPKMMITHDCPNTISSLLKENIYREETITRQAFDIFFENHKPEVWIFGHWHLSFDKVVDGTRFICLDVLEYIDL